MAKLKNCKKPGPPGEPHYIAEIPQKYIDMFYDKVEHQPNGCEFFTSKLKTQAIAIGITTENQITK